MPEVILKFNLPEDNSAYELCHQAGFLYGALWDLEHELFRPIRKYDKYPNAKMQELATKIGDDALELVELLEQEFYRILEDNRVDLSKVG